MAPCPPAAARSIVTMSEKALSARARKITNVPKLLSFIQVGLGRARGGCGGSGSSGGCAAQPPMALPGRTCRPPPDELLAAPPLDAAQLLEATGLDAVAAEARARLQELGGQGSA
jgi:hypothetical protein